MKKPVSMRIDAEVLDQAREIVEIEKKKTGYNVSITNIFEKAVRELYQKLMGKK